MTDLPQQLILNILKLAPCATANMPHLLLFFNIENSLFPQQLSQFLIPSARKNGYICEWWANSSKLHQKLPKCCSNPLCISKIYHLARYTPKEPQQWHIYWSIELFTSYLNYVIIDHGPKKHRKYAPFIELSNFRHSAATIGFQYGNFLDCP